MDALTPSKDERCPLKRFLQLLRGVSIVYYMLEHGEHAPILWVQAYFLTALTTPVTTDRWYKLLTRMGLYIERTDDGLWRIPTRHGQSEIEKSLFVTLQQSHQFHTPGKECKCHRKTPFFCTYDDAFTFELIYQPNLPVSYAHLGLFMKCALSPPDQWEYVCKQLKPAVHYTIVPYLEELLFHLHANTSSYQVKITIKGKLKSLL